MDSLLGFYPKIPRFSNLKKGCWHPQNLISANKKKGTPLEIAVLEYNIRLLAPPEPYTNNHINFAKTTTSFLAAEEGLRPETAVPLKEALGPRVGNKVVSYANSTLLIIIMYNSDSRDSGLEEPIGPSLHGLVVSDQRVVPLCWNYILIYYTICLVYVAMSLTEWSVSW